MHFTSEGEKTVTEKRALFVGISFELFQHLQSMLRKQGIEASLSITVTEGMRMFAQDTYHLLLLELTDEENKSRIQLVTALRKIQPAPILLMTGEETVESVTEVIDNGVDICIPKELPPQLIGVAVVSLIRRYTDYNHQDRPGNMGKIPIQRGDIYLDPLSCTVEVRGRKVVMRPREFSLLHYFMRNPNIVLTAEQICAGAWQLEGGYGGDVSGPVSILRHDIEPDPQNPIYIETVPQFGYRFTARTVETCGE